jgi:site-specific DNA recombinase
MSERAFIYVRQSVHHPEGIERGVAKCMQLVEEHGWQLAAPPFEDNNVSAAKTRSKNSAWARMIEGLRRGEAQIVVGVDLDRLVRSIVDLGTLVQLRAKVVTVNGEIDLTTADGELRATIITAMAQFEVRRKSERQKRANTYRISQGKPVAGGRRRFGFEKDHLTLRESEVAWVVYMHQAVVDNASLRSIANEMNAHGVPCVTKGIWNAARIRKILVNPAYRGYVIHHGEAYPSEFAPVIIGKELAERVDAVMGDPSRTKTPGPQRTALMSSLATCGTCGSQMTSGGNQASQLSGGLYVCRALKDRTAEGVGHSTIRRHILDERVRREVAKAFIFGRVAIQRLPSTQTLGDVQARIDELRRAKSDLLDLVGTLPLSELRPRIAKLEKKIEAQVVERESIVATDVHARMLSETRDSLMRPGGEVSIDEHVQVLNKFRERFDGLDLDKQRALVGSLLETTVVKGRGASRIRIRHLVATSLNESEEVA